VKLLNNNLVPKFYLGTHHSHWLKLVDLPLFISRRTLDRVKKLPVALGSWALDSGGFTELNLNGKWSISPKSYADEVRRYSEEIGQLDFASIQDWMCEDFVLERTGKTIKEHQELTVQSYLDLKSIAPDLPWLPVLQGFSFDDYLRHLEMYVNKAIDLTKFNRVGIGSICRREGTKEAGKIISTLTKMYNLNLHGFGFKINGLKTVGHLLGSSDSMAWSINARRDKPLDGCSHKTCANCMKYALIWREKVLRILGQANIENVKQSTIFDLIGKDVYACQNV